MRLTRPHTGNRSGLTALGHPPFSSFGFSIRGGREHNTGFFISNVIPGSEAAVKGLQVGDQIIRVGGCNGSYRVDDAVHKEITQFISNQDRLTMKVRGQLAVSLSVEKKNQINFDAISCNLDFNSNVVFAHCSLPLPYTRCWHRACERVS